MNAFSGLTAAMFFTTLIASICQGQMSRSDYNTIRRAALEAQELQLEQEQMEKREAEGRAKGEDLFGVDTLDAETSKWVRDHSTKQGTKIQVGYWGYSDQLLKVLNVVSPTEILVQPIAITAEPMLIRGLAAEKVTDGIEFILHHPFVIQDTYKYRATSGASKTVLVLDTSKFSDQLKNEQAAAEEALYKPWEIGEEEVVAKYVGYSKGLVTLIRKTDGTSVEIPISDLEKKDQVWVRAEIKRLATEKAATEKAAKAAKMRGSKRQQAKPRSEPGIVAKEKMKVEKAEVDAGRTRWSNETYDCTVRWVKGKGWEEVDNKTGQVNHTYQEKSRNKDFIEIFCPKRQYLVRLLSNTMELKKDGEWIWVANGKWDEGSGVSKSNEGPKSPMLQP